MPPFMTVVGGSPHRGGISPGQVVLGGLGKTMSLGSKPVSLFPRGLCLRPASKFLPWLPFVA